MKSIESRPQSLADQVAAVAIAVDHPAAGQLAAQMAGVSLKRTSLKEYCENHDLDPDEFRANLDKTD